MKTVVFTFGRFNPPTTGHIKLVEKLVKTAREYSADYRIYLSRSQDAKKNPLKLTDKVKYLKLSAPRYKSGIRSEEIISVLLSENLINVFTDDIDDNIIYKI